MTDSDERPETWRPVAPMDGCTFSGYECSDKGHFRSIDRKQGSRQLQGKVLATRRNDDGYVLVTIRCDSTDPDHKRAHTFSGHKVVLTTFDRPCPDGMETLHSGRGPAFNWWPEGIRWGTKPENNAERTVALAAAGRAANGRSMPSPRPPKPPCVLCGGPVDGTGRRCHACIVAIGQEAADLLRSGMRLEDVNDRLEYGSPVYLHNLAVKYGGWGQCPTCSRPVADRPSATLRDRVRAAFGRPGGDR